MYKIIKLYIYTSIIASALEILLPNDRITVRTCLTHTGTCPSPKLTWIMWRSGWLRWRRSWPEDTRQTRMAKLAVPSSLKPRPWTIWVRMEVFTKTGGKALFTSRRLLWSWKSKLKPFTFYESLDLDNCQRGGLLQWRQRQGASRQRVQAAVPHITTLHQVRREMEIG